MDLDLRVATHPRERPDGTPPNLRRLLDALGPLPALVIDRCWDVVGRNAALATLLPALGEERLTPDAPPHNVVEYALTNPAWRAAVPDWRRFARAAVDGLRTSLAGVNASDPCVVRGAEVIAQLTAASDDFRAWWSAHGVWMADAPLSLAVEHPRVGRLELDVTVLDLRSAPGRTLIVYVPCDGESGGRLTALVRSGGRPVAP